MSATSLPPFQGFSECDGAKLIKKIVTAKYLRHKLQHISKRTKLNDIIFNQVSCCILVTTSHPITLETPINTGRMWGVTYTQRSHPKSHPRCHPGNKSNMDMSNKDYWHGGKMTQDNSDFLVRTLRMHHYWCWYIPFYSKPPWWL